MSDRRVTFGWLDLAAPDADRDGVVGDRAGLTLDDEPAGQRDYDDPFGDSGPRDYDYGLWVSPPQPTRFAATSLVVSWAAETPGTSWVGLGVRGRTGADADWSRWFVVARWAGTDDEIHPTTVPGQAADGVTVETDELRIDPDRTWVDYQVRVILFRLAGTDDRPRLTRLGVMTSAVSRGPEAELPPTSTPTLSGPVELDVPPYSQQLHRDHYPRYDGGGQSWCSPASLAMVLAHFDALPPPHDYAWVEPQLPDRFVPYIARACFDHAFGGAGNWAFNTAYAAAVAGRGGVLRRGRDPADPVPGLRGGRADRRRLRHQGPSDGVDRVHRHRRPDRQRPGLPSDRQRRRRTHDLPARPGRGAVAAFVRRDRVRRPPARASAPAGADRAQLVTLPAPLAVGKS
jgi:hypothetical protein